MQYSVERMREKVQEIKGVVSVEGTVRTQDADFIIRGGVLERYNGNDTHVVIPDSVVRIGESAFERCSGIQSVTFPSGVTEISSHAFFLCRCLEKIKLPDTLVEIGYYCFEDCSALKQVTLPETVKTIGNWAFQGCTGLEVINIPDHVQRKDRNSYHDLYGVFWNCPALREIIISEEQKENLLIYMSPNGDRFIAGSRMFVEPVDDETPLYPDVAPWYLDFERKFDAEKLREVQEMRRAEGKCQHCGGQLSGLFTKKCVRCGKPKDY